MVLVLKIPNNKDLSKLFTDTSDFAAGVVLSQKNMQTNLWHPVAFFSKLLNIYKRNYKIYDKELLVVIQELKKYRHYLEENPYKIEIWSDHQTVTVVLWTSSHRLYGLPLL